MLLLVSEQEFISSTQSTGQVGKEGGQSFAVLGAGHATIGFDTSQRKASKTLTRFTKKQARAHFYSYREWLALFFKIYV